MAATEAPAPPKKPPTAFFLFCSTRRQDVKKSNPAFGVSDVAKQLGAEWKALDDAARAKFQEEVDVMRVSYTEQMKQYEAKYGPVVKASAAAVQGDEQNTTVFPIARVKRVLKADADVKTVSKEAVFLLAKAAESVVECLARGAATEATSGRRRQVHEADVARAVRRHQALDFLREDLPLKAAEEAVRAASRVKERERNASARASRAAKAGGSASLQAMFGAQANAKAKAKVHEQEQARGEDGGSGAADGGR